MGQQQHDDGEAMMAGWRADGRRVNAGTAARRALVARVRAGAASGVRRGHSSGVEGQRRGVDALGGSGVAGGRQRRSERARARSSSCALRTVEGERGRERGKREREWREKKRGQPFDSVQTQNFQLKLKKF